MTRIKIGRDRHLKTSVQNGKILLSEIRLVDLTPLEEFMYYIRQFARFFETGAKLIKRKLKFWVRLAPKYS